MTRQSELIPAWDILPLFQGQNVPRSGILVKKGQKWALFGSIFV